MEETSLTLAQLQLSFLLATKCRATTVGGVEWIAVESLNWTLVSDYTAMA